MVNIEEYKQTIKQFAENKTNYRFQTLGKDYALVIIERMFLNAKSSIKYTTKNLFDSDVEKNMSFIEALCFFLASPQSKLSILVEELPENISDKNPFNPYYRLYQHPAYKQGRIKIGNSKGGHFMNNGKQIQFCVADSKMYRIETDIDKCLASCNFYDNNMSANLENAFETAFSTIKSFVELDKIFEE